MGLFCEKKRRRGSLSSCFNCVRTNTVNASEDFVVKKECSRNQRQRVMALPSPPVTTQDLRDHLMSLIQDRSECEKEDEEDEFDKCGLCGQGQILLAPEIKCCCSCGGMIERNGSYFGDSAHKRRLCLACFCNPWRPKVHSRLVPMKNDQTQEEPWVQCDVCEEWHHQICGMFNSKEKSGSYKCPKCWLDLMERPHIVEPFFTAKTLPKTALSDHIHRRLSIALARDTQARAMHAKLSPNQVPQVKDLSVRVVLSTKKSVKVNKALLSAIGDQSYPSVFEYTSKLILLFQKISGIDVCVFSLYVQEYGAECKKPNQRCAYISYLDSIKLLQPNIMASSGEPLRTVIYHEVLISYLEYEKLCGFTNCYIWSCPPQKGDEYIFNCHPKNQKTPEPEALKKWYQSMVEKAAEEGIVVNHTTFFDRFFTGNRWSSLLYRLPYFDGDCWPALVEDLLIDIKEETKEEEKRGIKLPGVVITDILLMYKLSEFFRSWKEEFMVIDLKPVCSNCCDAIISGNLWYNSNDRKCLCERCHDRKSRVDNRSSKSQCLDSKEQNRVPDYMATEKDRVLFNEVCASRTDLLGFFEKNSLQFDTLRRAKHSSMMLLYQLHRK